MKFVVWPIVAWIITASADDAACERLGLKSVVQSSVAEDYCVSVFAEDLGVSPRGIIADEENNLIYIDANRTFMSSFVPFQHTSVVLVYDDDMDGEADGKIVLLSFSDEYAGGLNHGLELLDDWLYVSTEMSVYRYKYDANARSLDESTKEKIIKDVHGATQEEVELRGPGGHKTRTLAFDKDGLLYVQVGSEDNVDKTPFRTHIRRFDISAAIPEGGLDWYGGEIVAYGLRNTVAMAFDNNAELWGVDMGADNLVREDVGLDYNNGPAEELHKFDLKNSMGGFHGYPYCFSHFNGTDAPLVIPAQQYAWPIENDDEHDDEWCQNPENNIPATLGLQPHGASLGMAFSDGKMFDPNSAFVALHGSWNLDEPDGYKVIQISIVDGVPTEVNDFLESTSDDPTKWRVRPVDVTFGADGAMYVTVDTDCSWMKIASSNANMAMCQKGVMFRVQYAAPSSSAAPSATTAGSNTNEPPSATTAAAGSNTTGATGATTIDLISHSFSVGANAISYALPSFSVLVTSLYM